MQKVAILIEMRDGKLKPSNLGVISAARESGGERIALLLEGNAAAVVEKLQAYGIDRVLEISAAHGTIEWNPELWADAIVQAMEHYEIQTLLGLASIQGKNLLSRVAARLEAPLVLDCIAVNIAEHTVKKSQYSGKAIAEFKTYGNYHVYGIRPNAIAAVPSPCEAKLNTFQASIKSNGLTVKEIQRGLSDRIDLTEADVIIAGGRGRANGRNFETLFKCAQKIPAAVGASRVAVDSGWVNHTMQVGQTGKTVSPKVYIACGISGSVQHFAGMKTAGMIIAINKDPHAAIMSKCDYAVCADLFDIVPALTEKLK